MEYDKRHQYDTVIFGVYDPDERLLVYVGSTRSMYHFENRKLAIMRYGGYMANTPMGKWLAELEREGKSPLVRIIAQIHCPDRAFNNADSNFTHRIHRQLEKLLIKKASTQLNKNLLNVFHNDSREKQMIRDRDQRREKRLAARKDG